MRRLYAWVIAIGMTSCHPGPSTVGNAATSSPPKKSAPSKEPLAAPVLAEDATPITFAKMTEFPEPGWQVPRSAKIAPDGKSATFLMSEGDTEEMALHATNLATGETKVILSASTLTGAQASSSASKAPASPSLAQELRNERQRKRIKGITEYQWAEKANVMLVPSGSDVFVVDAGNVTDLTTSDEDAIDPKICNDGSKVALVRGSELSLIDVATKKETPLTGKAPAGVTRGQSDFNGQEEFGETSGHFFAPSCKSLVYLEVDEREVAEEPILGHRGGKPSLMMQKYPRAGGKNPKVTVWLADLATKKSVAIPLPAGVSTGAYLGRFHFTPDSKSLVFWALDRSQRKADLVLTTLGPKPTSRVAHSVSVTKGWVEMTDVAISPDGSGALTILEQSGHHHLVRIDLGDKSAAPVFLTEGDWDVFGIEGVREDRKSVLVSANRDDTIGKLVYEVTGPGQIRLLTEQKGVHDVSVAPSGKAFVDVFSSLTTPPRAVVRVDDKTIPLPVSNDPDIAALKLRSPEIIELSAASGDKLFGALLAPRTVDPGRRYPLVVMVYGGPGVQTVRNRWSPRLLWQHLADRGFYVFQVDNRGSSGRGPAFEQAIDRKLGEVELADQLAALDQILKQHPIDPSRVGIYGHSYGGFLAALAMLKAPGRFHAGISASPVTDWRLYDTAYTERYMGTPEENAAGYDAADLEKLAKNLEGKLLVVHALMDENVHFQATADLVDALVREKKDFQMFVYPGERHGYRSPPARLHAMQTATRFLVNNLGAVDLEAQSE
ncbi:MAG: S9 family peptidase [Polyangiaceae bacterium]|nr:S9 family peptidase [Polyangiaceae bacterium]